MSNVNGLSRKFLDKMSAQFGPDYVQITLDVEKDFQGKHASKSLGGGRYLGRQRLLTDTEVLTPRLRALIGDVPQETRAGRTGKLYLVWINKVRESPTEEVVVTDPETGRKRTERRPREWTVLPLARLHDRLEVYVDKTASRTLVVSRATGTVHEFEVDALASAVGAWLVAEELLPERLLSALTRRRAGDNEGADESLDDADDQVDDLGLDEPPPMPPELEFLE